MPTLPLTPDELLTTTRSVRKRLDLTRDVPIGLVRECLEVALQAPSGSNRQGWHWLVVTDADRRAAIGEVYRRAVAAYLESPGSAGALFADDPDRGPVQQRVGDSVAYLGEHLGEAPVLVIPCLTAKRLDDGNQAGLWGSLLPAAWSYMLAARARGLGTAWTTLHLEYEDEVATLLGLPDDVRQGALIPTAYYTGETFRKAPRQPLDEVLHVDRW
ncbi:nitroreductase family protein [Angustibacter luteus]|uniref:Nitroreductase family protein n=1 Tax=Angustibacter luteus TaxID=658456 RepID=A0ABW1JDH8_9ACTN